MMWSKKKKDRVDPEAIERQATESLNETKSQQIKVNNIVGFLNNRKEQNGFGEDFEFTLRPRET